MSTHEMDAPALRRALFSALGGDLSINEEDRLTVHWKGKLTETTFYGTTDPLDLAGVPNWPEDAGAALVLCVDLCGRVAIDTISVPNTVIVNNRAIQVSVVRQPDDVALALSRLALVALEQEQQP